MVDRDEAISAVENMKENRRRILKALAKYGELASGKIPPRAEIPRGSKHEFLTDLQDAGLVERVGTIDREGGIDHEYLYALTDVGADAVGEVFDPPRPDEFEKRVGRLEDDVDGLMKQTDKLWSRLDSVDGRVSTVASHTDEVQEETRRAEKMASNAWDAIENRDSRLEDVERDIETILRHIRGNANG